MWVCPAAFHSCALPDVLLAERVDDALDTLGLPNWDGVSIVRYQARLSRWRARREEAELRAKRRRDYLAGDVVRKLERDLRDGGPATS